MKRFATSWIAILIFGNVAIGQQVARMSAIEIMDRMTKVYASCSSYMDEGKTKDSFGTQDEHSSFTTVFVRPSHFRFEESSSSYHRKEWNHFIAWKAGEQGSVWPGGMQYSTGQFGGTAPFLNVAFRNTAERIILGLLLAGLFRRSALNEFTDVTLAGQDSVAGRLTFRIDGNLMGQATSLWIDQQQFLVLKIRQKAESRRLTTTTTFRPRVNVEISTDQLAFKPPSVPAPISGPSGVEVINFNRSEQVRKSGPVRTYLDYVYEMKIRNRGLKEIAAVAWDHLVMDPATKRIRGQSHFSYQKLKPNETDILRDTIFQGQSRVITVESETPEGENSDSEHVQVSCVIYADGSWWKNPSAKLFECEYLRSLSRRRK